MYYLPIIINNRKTHICQLGIDEQKFVPKFIVKADTSKVPLIRIQHQAKIFADEGISKDLYLEGRWNPQPEDFNNDTGHYNAYTLEFIHKTKQSKLTRGVLKSLANKKKPFVIEPPVKEAGNLQDLVLSWEGKTVKGHSFPVIIRLKTKAATYEYKIEFYVARPEHIYNVVFDFGSEASQMAYLSKKENAIKRVELLHQMNRHFYYDKIDKRAEYLELYQFDPDDDTLYTSNFLVKKENEDDLNEYARPFDNGEESIIHLMMKKMDYYQKQQRVFERIPNLKLTEFGDFRKFDITLSGENEPFHEVKDEFFQAILNQFFMMFIKGLNGEKRYAKKNFENWENISKKIIITLLVPNIYDQQKVTSLIRNTHTNFNQLCSKNNTDPAFNSDLKIDAVEVQTISESDASFLGFTLSKLRQNLKPNSNYLIIDAGKGTLDISVIKVEEAAYNYSGIYRGGIAGAGNVLSYAFLENLSAIAVGTNEGDRRKFIKKFLNIPIGDQLNLIEYIEIMKKRYSSILPIPEHAALALTDRGDALHSPAFWLDEADSATFGKELKKVIKNAIIDAGLSLGDYYGIIQKTTDDLVAEAIKIVEGLDEYSLNSNRKGENKKKLELEYVILSGRSFLLKSFRETVIQALVDNAIVADKSYVIWDENLAKKSCVEGPLKAPSGINRNTNLVGFPIPESIILNGKQNTKNKSTNQFEILLGKYFKQSGVTINQNIIFLSEKFFLEGLPAKINDAIRVGDVNYNPDKILTQSNRKNEKVDVIFTGEEFKMRSSQSSAKLEPMRLKSGLNKFLWKSLFPHVKEANGEGHDSANIPITII